MSINNPAAGQPDNRQPPMWQSLNWQPLNWRSLHWQPFNNLRRLFNWQPLNQNWRLPNENLPIGSVLMTAPLIVPQFSTFLSVCLVHSMVMLVNLLAGLCFLFGGLDDGTTFGLGTSRKKCLIFLLCLERYLAVFREFWVLLVGCGFVTNWKTQVF